MQNINAKVIEVTLLPHQEKFLYSKKKICALIGGIGSGKTWTGVHFILKKLKENPETTGFIGANSYSQLRDATLAALFSEFDRLKIKFTYNAQSGFISVHSFKNAQIKVASLENYNTLRGMEIGYGWLDESRDTKEDAFDVVLGRLRCKHSKKLELRITTSPSGFNWLYERLVGEKATDEVEVIYGTTYANTFLPQDYIKTLESQYDAQNIEQELNAKFVNLKSGKIYHSFDRLHHVREMEIMDNPVKVGMDFNIENMNACIGEIQGDIIYIYDELAGFYNTFEIARELRKNYAGADIIPDSTGKARKTSSKKSDHQILKDAGFNIVSNRSNPFIEDRWNTLNKLFQEDRIFIHPRCKKLIKELEQADKENGMKDEGKHYHISVSLGYLGFKYFPLKIKQTFGNTKTRQL